MFSIGYVILHNTCNSKLEKMEMKFFKIVSSEIGVVFEHSLSLQEAKSLLKKWEDNDKANGIYTPDFYEIKQEDTLRVIVG